MKSVMDALSAATWARARLLSDSAVNKPREELAEIIESLSPGLTEIQMSYIIERVSKWAKQQADSIVELKMKGVISLLLRPKSAADRLGLAFAFGLFELEGMSMREVAKKNGFTASALSKRAIYWRDHFGLRSNGHFKSPSEVASFKKAQTENHWRTAEKSK